jgi:hypothetical protein
MTTTTASEATSSEPALDEHEVAALIEIIDDRKVLEEIIALIWQPDGLLRIRALIIEHVHGMIGDLEIKVADLERGAREDRAAAMAQRREGRAAITRRANRYQADADHARVRIECLQAIVDRFAALT